MLNRAAAIEALMRCLDEDIDREAVLEILRQIHPFDLSDLQEGIDELEAMVIEVRKEKTVTVEDMEGELRRLLLDGEGELPPWLR